MIRSKPHRRSTGSVVGGSKKNNIIYCDKGIHGLHIIIYCDERIHGLHIIRLTLYYKFSCVKI